MELLTLQCRAIHLHHTSLLIKLLSLCLSLNLFIFKSGSRLNLSHCFSLVKVRALCLSLHLYYIYYMKILHFIIVYIILHLSPGGLVSGERGPTFHAVR